MLGINPAPISILVINKKRSCDVMMKGKTPTARLYKSIFQARYKAMLSFYNLLYPTASKLDEYPHWITNMLSIILRDWDKHCSLAIGAKSWAFDQDTDDVSNEEERINKAAREISSGLELSSYIRLGFRRRYLINTPMTFKEINTILNVKFLSQDEVLLKIFPFQMDDLLYRVDCSDEKFKYHINLGPTHKTEIPKWIEFNQEHHLDPNEAQYIYPQILDSYPDVAVFIDVDVYRDEKEIQVEDIDPFYIESRKQIESIITGVTDYIFNK